MLYDDMNSPTKGSASCRACVTARQSPRALVTLQRLYALCRLPAPPRYRRHSDSEGVKAQREAVGGGSLHHQSETQPGGSSPSSSSVSMVTSSVWTYNTLLRGLGHLCLLLQRSTAQIFRLVDDTKPAVQ